MEKDIDFDKLAEELLIEQELLSPKRFTKPCVVVYDDRRIIILKTTINEGEMEVVSPLNANEFESEGEMEQFIVDNSLRFETFDDK